MFCLERVRSMEHEEEMEEELSYPFRRMEGAAENTRDPGVRLLPKTKRHGNCC